MYNYLGISRIWGSKGLSIASLSGITWGHIWIQAYIHTNTHYMHACMHAYINTYNACISGYIRPHTYIHIHERI